MITCTAVGGPIRLNGVEFAAGNQDFVYAPPPLGDIPQNASVTINVEFRPGGLPQALSTELMLQYDGANGPATARVPVTGEIIPPGAGQHVLVCGHDLGQQLHGRRHSPRRPRRDAVWCF